MTGLEWSQVDLARAGEKRSRGRKFEISAGTMRRYAHVSADHMAEYAERLARPRIVSDANLAHGRETTERSAS